MCAKRKLLPRPRNHGTMTESAFWGGIRSALRQKSRWWKPKDAAKLLVRRKYSGKNKRQKWEFLCAHCDKWYMDKETEVDHIIPAGSLKSSIDLPGFVERLFCEVEGFQVLCKVCHLKKTQEERINKSA